MLMRMQFGFAISFSIGTVAIGDAEVAAPNGLYMGGTMQRTAIAENITPTPWPWTLSSIRTALTEAAMAGYRLGLREPTLAEVARQGVVAEGDVPDEQYEALEGLVETLTSAAAIRFADHWEEDAAYWIEGGVEAAVVRGLQRCGADHAESPSLDQRDLEHNLHDPEWIAAIADDTLEQVVTRLALLGHPVPGSQDFLDFRQNFRDFVRVLPIQHDDGRRQVRTSWIRDHDDGRIYQWCVVRRGTEVFVGRRKAGENSPTVELSLRTAEAELLSEMLAQVVEGWRAA